MESWIFGRWSSLPRLAAPVLSEGLFVLHYCRTESYDFHGFVGLAFVPRKKSSKVKNLYLDIAHQLSVKLIGSWGPRSPPSSIADTPWVGLHTHSQPLPAGSWQGLS